MVTERDPPKWSRNVAPLGGAPPETSKQGSLSLLPFPGPAGAGLHTIPVEAEQVIVRRICELGRGSNLYARSTHLRTEYPMRARLIESRRS